MFENRQQAAAAVYRSFLNSGFSDAQARALTAEVNRENSLREDLIFGSHTDPANRALNIGMLSWQGDRAPRLQKFLASRGLLDERGRMVRSPEALQAQTDFIRYEMETNPAYSRTREEFLGNPNIDPSAAAVVLGDNYIRWRRTDPKYSGSGNRAIAKGYALLEGLDGSDSSYRPIEAQSQATPEARRAQYGLGDRDPGTEAQVIEAVRLGDMTRSEAARYVSEDLLDGTLEEIDNGPLEEPKKEASFMDRLGDAAANLDLSMISGAPRLQAPTSMEIDKGRLDSGSRALQRMGIASLA